MNENNEIKKVFFAFEAFSPWPRDLPEGRYLEENDRHMTIAFLGNIHYPVLERILPSFPLPKIKVGLAGKFNRCHFLPKKRPNVVAWHVDLFDKEYDLNLYQKEVVNWLQSHGFSVRIHKKGFLPHVTICRRPFEYGEWRKTFHPLPVVIQSVHLYESLGHLKYKPLWTHRLKPPFEEIEHTADVAFHIRGENLRQILIHAQVALAFLFPPLLSCFSDTKKVEDLDDIIIELNALITETDKKLGCPFKAVSFHGNLLEEEDHTLMWEMIVDV